jgi:hypothetical protein
VHAAPFADRAPAFHADVASDLVYLRHGAQLGQRPFAPVGHHARDFQPVAAFFDFPDFVLAVVGVKGERPGDHGFGVGGRQAIGIKQEALHFVVDARDLAECGVDAFAAVQHAAGQHGQAAQRERGAQKVAACRAELMGVGNARDSFVQHGGAVDVHTGRGFDGHG